jgi:hypothetical protein
MHSSRWAEPPYVTDITLVLLPLDQEDHDVRRHRPHFDTVTIDCPEPLLPLLLVTSRAPSMPEAR